MNKITSTLAGLAFVATASIAPAFAQGTFTYSGGPIPFTFSAGVGGLSVSAIPVFFNSSVPGVANSSGVLVLSGGTQAFGSGTFGTFTGVTETFTPTSPAIGPLGAFSDVGTVFVSQRSATTFDLASDTTTFTTSGTNFDLVPGSPVPEASTTASFGLLLALGLGGIVVAAKRKKAGAAV